MRPGADRVTVAIESRPSLSSSASDVAPEQLRLDAQPLASESTPLIGAITGAPDVASRGSGDGPGAADAVQARIQGEVWIECVILADGTVGPLRVVRSLDSRYGLDHEAIKAAKQWRSLPGTRNGRPVAVTATIGLTFRIH